jgi:hypothetical protein
MQELQPQTLNKNNELNVTSNLTPTARLVMTNTKQKQQIKCDMELDPIARLATTNTKQEQCIKCDIELDTICKTCNDKH